MQHKVKRWISLRGDSRLLGLRQNLLPSEILDLQPGPLNIPPFQQIQEKRGSLERKMTTLSSRILVVNDRQPQLYG